MNKKLKKDLKARGLHVNKTQYRSMKAFAIVVFGFLLGFAATQILIGLTA